MQSFPLAALDLEAAIAMQFRLVDTITRHFNGLEILSAGDYGVRLDLGRPAFTARVEETLADFFGVPACVLVRGAGSGALRAVHLAALHTGDRVMIHRAPLYPTVRVTAEAMGLRLEEADFSSPDEIRAALDSGPAAVHIQHARQRISDSYDLDTVIGQVRSYQKEHILIMVDDNYAPFKVPKIGVEMGADVSCFSLFKVQGPEGLGCILGPQWLVDRVRQQNNSGGCLVQGPEAMEALRAMVHVPVITAVQSRVVQEVADRLNRGEVPGVAAAFRANNEESNILVELDRPIAQVVLAQACRLGAAAHPVGAESRYEVAPMFYRISKIMTQEDPHLARRMIRVNPLRAGADTVIRLLRDSLQAAAQEV